MKSLYTALQAILFLILPLTVLVFGYWGNSVAKRAPISSSPENVQQFLALVDEDLQDRTEKELYLIDALRVTVSELEAYHGFYSRIRNVLIQSLDLMMAIGSVQLLFAGCLVYARKKIQQTEACNAEKRASVERPS